MSAVLGVVVLRLLLAGAGEGEQKAPSVLIMPFEARGGVSRDLAEQINTLVAAEAAKFTGFRVVSLREIQGALNQEQLKQAAGCDAISCATEIAGALDTDQVVMGSVGQVGSSYVLNLVRVDSRNSRVLARTSGRIRGLDEDQLLDGLPGIVGELMGAAKQLAAPPSSASSTPPGKPAPDRMPKRVLAAALGGAGVVTAVVLGVLAVTLGAGSVALWGVDRVATGGTGHVVPYVAAMGANAAFWAGAPLFLAGVLAGSAGLAAAGITWMAP